MSRFERTLVAVILVFLLGMGAAGYWRVSRPVFVSAPLSEDELRIWPLGHTGQYRKYLIGHRLLTGTAWRFWIDRYQQGELVKSMPFGGGTEFSSPGERGLQSVYVGLTTTMDMEREHAILLGTKGITSTLPVDLVESLPVELHLSGRIRLIFDESMVMGVVVQSNEYVDRDDVFDQRGRLNEQILQHENVYVIRLQLSRAEQPK